ncbi:MAG: class I SAM-dependent methyltransferase [Acidobacteriota bacterium]|nr:class I SAM-dependent methyltransferase [Acidobacteriota bacterium]
MSIALRDQAGPFETAARAHEINSHHLEAAEPRVISAEHGYELWARSYDQEPNPLLALEERLLTPILPNLNGRMVLDLACGTGRWLAALMLRGAISGIGIDFSQAMLAAAGSKPLLCGRLVRADCLTTPLPRAAVDVVVCSFAIGHISKIEALAAELARVARPHAAIYVSDMHPEAYRRGWRTGFRSHCRPVEISTFCHSLTDVHDAFEAQGLELAECIEGRLEEPERSIFERAGRLDRFQQVTDIPAIFVSQFRQPDPA